MNNTRENNTCKEPGRGNEQFRTPVKSNKDRFERYGDKNGRIKLSKKVPKTLIDK